MLVQTLFKSNQIIEIFLNHKKLFMVDMSIGDYVMLFFIIKLKLSLSELSVFYISSSQVILYFKIIATPYFV